MSDLYKYNNKIISYSGKLLNVAKLYFIQLMDVFGYGYNFTRNMALSSVGGHDNALMGSYLLATTNNSISIVGFLATDTVWDIGTGLEVTNITKAKGVITLQNLAKYGAFEVKRAGALIGKYCLTERSGSRIINQYRGAGYLPNGLLNGTLTNIWQKSNAYYCETNKTGYSIAGSGWYADSGGTQALTQYSLIPTDLNNPTKCLAWVNGVQQDSQYIGKARNNVSLIPIGINMTRVNAPYTQSTLTITSHYMRVYCYVTDAIGGSNGTTIAGQAGFGVGDSRNAGIMLNQNYVYLSYDIGNILSIPMARYLRTPICIEGGFANTVAYLRITDMFTGGVTEVTYTNFPTSNIRTGVVSGLKANYAVLGDVLEVTNGTTERHLIPNQHGTSFYDAKKKVTIALSGTVTDVLQNVNCGIFPHISQGYELWTNGTNYQMYPLADDGTRIITPSGYTLVETVAAGNVPSDADSRLTTVKYSLANSNELYKVVPEAFNTDATVTPKVLSYNELSALSDNNTWVSKTESNGKITNLKIKTI